MHQTQKRSRPQIIQAMVDSLKQPDIRSKLLFTFIILVIYRFIAHVSVPGIDRAVLQDVFDKNQLLGMLEVFSGGSMRNLSVVALGVYPYITASIIMTVLAPVIPSLQALSQEGEAGRQKINQYTHRLTVPLAMFSAYGQLIFLRNQGVFTTDQVGLKGGALLPTVAMVFAMTAGTMFLVWLGERITEKGIGNGISIIIFANIVASVPQTFGNFIGTSDLGGLIWFVVFSVVIIFAIVIFTEAQRRIPVQYSKSVYKGGRMYRQAGASHIPLRVNSAGMIPLIFAMSIILLPSTVASYFANADGGGVANWIMKFLGGSQPYYWIAYFILVVAFTFFYTMVVFQQQNLAETIQRQGGFVPGIRPGKPTNKYLNGVLNRITWGGALFLGIIAIMPYLANLITQDKTMQTAISSTSLLILVGVVLDTMRQIESQLIMRKYEGFIK
ncbi:MAG: preprotein translocase subunit SecY [Chloroflexi bacterium]|nr:preprotein translocase subunit SecY [Chloroflexota bacterium]